MEATSEDHPKLKRMCTITLVGKLKEENSNVFKQDLVYGHC